MTDLSSLDRLLERFPEQEPGTALPWRVNAEIGVIYGGDWPVASLGSGTINGAMPDGMMAANAAFIPLAANGYRELRSALVALREQHDALRAALRTVLATMDDGKDFHTQTEALEAARALLGNAVGEAR